LLLFLLCDTVVGLNAMTDYIFTSSEYFEKHFGKRADNTRKMYNGMLKCFYYQYFKK
jgi:putative N6-adenine-specific DNA methylase